jgi:hypothetical protein
MPAGVACPQSVLARRQLAVATSRRSRHAGARRRSVGACARPEVVHGKNSGEHVPDRFSNVEGSLQTSLTLFVTSSSYIGANGYSMRREGLEPGIDD